MIINIILYFLLIVTVCAIVILPVCYFASKAEAKDWNGGYCPICGRELRHFDTDSQGGHGWCCDDCGYTAWVSYHKWVYRTRKTDENDKGATA